MKCFAGALQVLRTARRMARPRTAVVAGKAREMESFLR